MKKSLLLMALALPLEGSQLLFGLVPFRAELNDLAMRAASCWGSVCAARPAGLKDAVASVPATPGAAVAAVGFAPGRGFLILPPPTPKKQ